MKQLIEETNKLRRKKSIRESSDLPHLIDLMSKTVVNSPERVENDKEKSLNNGFNQIDNKKRKSQEFRDKRFFKHKLRRSQTREITKEDLFLD